MVHDLTNFREFLNTRLEEKSLLYKQKADLQQEFKKLEQARAEHIIEHNKNINQEE
jgi:hypothetical protein